MGRVTTAIVLGLVIATAARAGDMAVDSLKAQYRRPATIPFPADRPYSPQLATLGKMLFFDPRLSGEQHLSCASCHNPSFGFEVPIGRPIGATGKPMERKAPTILNAAWMPALQWDGRAATLEKQAPMPLTSPAAMNAKLPDVVGRLQAIPEYKAAFTALFPRDGVTDANLAAALATYERTVVADWAPFDRWIEGNEDAISPAARRGFGLFNGKAACASCHSGWNFTDGKFHDIGLVTTDIGRGKITPDDPKAMYAFKTPSLRNLTDRAPFGHAGQHADLEAILAFYASGGVDRPSKSPLMRKIELTTFENNDLIAFLRSLSAERTEVSLPNLPN